LWAAELQLNLQKLPLRIQVAAIVIVIVMVIVNAGFAERFWEGDLASPDLVARLRRIS
jgi:hypothetical protein